MSSRIDPSAIERSRPAGIPSDGGGEAALLFHIRAAGLPEPVKQLHFAWCCEHRKVAHGIDRGLPKCVECANELWQGQRGRERSKIPFHHYSHDRDWRFDVAWPAQLLAVEVDGGTWASGRHTRGAGYEADAEKLNEAVLRGWRVLRFTTTQVDSGEALAWIERALGVEG